MRILNSIVLWLGLCAFGTFPSGGVAPIAVPSEASAVGFNTLAFNQDANSGFDIDQTGTGIGHTWYNGFWQAQYNVPSSQITYVNGEIVLKWTTAQTSCPGTGYSVCPIALISTGNNHLTSYRGFGHGYFEMIARVVSLASGVPQTGNSPGQWAAFWLNGLTTGQQCIANGYQMNNIASPAPGYTELDILENQTSNSPHAAGTTYETYHYGTSVSGCGSGVGTQPSVVQDTGLVTDFSKYNKYAMLWTNGTVKFYINDVLIGTMTTNAPTETTLHTIQAWMMSGCSFAVNQACLGSVNEFDLHIQSIREWSCTPVLANQLTC